MDFLKDYCVLSYFTEEIFQHCQPFTCGKDDDMEVIEPMWLRKEIAGNVKRMWNKYK